MFLELSLLKLQKDFNRLKVSQVVFLSMYNLSGLLKPVHQWKIKAKLEFLNRKTYFDCNKNTHKSMHIYIDLSFLLKMTLSQ